MKKYVVTLVLVLAVIIIGFFTFGGAVSGEFDDFAACLAGKNITMYGAESCSWCQKEKAGFGDAFKLVPYVECPDEPQKCVAEGIEGTPTWIFPASPAGGPDGIKLVGYQGLEKLSAASGCELPQN